MKNYRLITMLVLLGLVLSGCQTASSLAGEDVSAQTLPVAAIDTPTNGSNLTTGPVTIYYHATDSTGVTLVELMINNHVVASTTISGGSPSLNITYQWAPSSAGSYTLGVRAQNGSGDWSNPANLTVSFNPPVVATATAAATITPTSSSVSSPTSDNQISSMYSPSISPSVVRDRETCGPSQVTASIYVSDPQGVNGVNLWVRLYDPFSHEYTDWVAMALTPRENGLYYSFFDLLYSGGWRTWFDDHAIAGGPDWYAQIEYQFVAQDQQGNYTHTPLYSGFTTVPCP